MVQNIIVMVIVLVAILFTSRRVYRILSNKKVRRGCAPEGDCSACSVPNSVKKGGSGSSSNGQKP